MTSAGDEVRDRVLVTPGALRDELAGPAAPALLDVRWALGDPAGYAHHLAGHLRAAGYVDLDTELAGPVGPRTGRHPLPTPAALQGAARRWGIRTGDRVVVYDATGGTAAARAWWLLRWGGLADVRLLDGGLAGWVAAGGPLETGPVVAAQPGDVRLPGHRMPVLDADAAAGRRGTVCCWTRGPVPATAVRSSRWTRAPGTSPARSAHRPPTTSTGRAHSCRGTG